MAQVQKVQKTADTTQGPVLLVCLLVGCIVVACLLGLIYSWSHFWFTAIIVMAVTLGAGTGLYRLVLVCLHWREAYKQERLETALLQQAVDMRGAEVQRAYHESDQIVAQVEHVRAETRIKVSLAQEEVMDRRSNTRARSLNPGMLILQDTHYGIDVRSGQVYAPRRGETTVREVYHEQQAALLPALTDEQELLMPEAPPFHAMSHLITESRLPLTYTASGPIFGEVNDLLSMALVGRPKRGKTTALMYYVCVLLTIQAEIWVWDPHGEMGALAGLNYFDRVGDMVESVPYIMRELADRDQLYRDTKRATGTGQVRKPLVLLADELPVIAQYEQTHTLKHSPLDCLRTMTLEARKWRGFTFISGQSLPAVVLPTITRDNLSSRVIFDCSAANARMVGLDPAYVKSLLPALKGADRGTHIADFATWSEPELADIPLTTDSDLRWVLSQRMSEEHFSRVPGNGTVSTILRNGREQPVEPEEHAVPERSCVPEEARVERRFVPVEEREQIIRLANSGIARRDMCKTLGKGKGYYDVVKLVLDEAGL